MRFGRRRSPQVSTIAVSPPPEEPVTPAKPLKSMSPKRKPTARGGHTEDTVPMEECEKRELFMMQLRDISTKHVDKTSQESRASVLHSEPSLDSAQIPSQVSLKKSQTGPASSPSQPSKEVAGTESDEAPLTYFANHVRHVVCSDLLCGLRDLSSEQERPPEPPLEKKSGTRVVHVMIPKTIDLEPVRVSSLGGEDSLAKNMRLLAELDEPDDKCHLNPLSDKLDVVVDPFEAEKHESNMSDTDVFEDITTDQ